MPTRKNLLKFSSAYQNLNSAPPTLALQTQDKVLPEPEEICDPALMLESWMPDPDAYGTFEDSPLETQSNNEIAIAFYLKNGLSTIGLDLYFYSNTDPEKHNVRLLRGKLLQ